MDDALQSMLMAWYQCGYATARYQTLTELGYKSSVQPYEATNPSSEHSADGSTSEQNGM